MPRADMLGTPTTSADIDMAGFKQQHNDYVAVGRLAFAMGLAEKPHDRLSAAS
jgi:hypothetical protein